MVAAVQTGSEVQHVHEDHGVDLYSAVSVQVTLYVGNDILVTEAQMCTCNRQDWIYGSHVSLQRWR